MGIQRFVAPLATPLLSCIHTTVLGTAVKYFISLPQLPNRQTGVVSLVTTLDGEGYSWELMAGSVPFFGIVPFEQSGLAPDEDHVISVTFMGLESDEMGLMPLRFDGFEYYAADLNVVSTVL